VRDRPLVWLRGEIKTPPFGAQARLKAGFLLRLLQQGETLGMPDSRPMPPVGPNCHELRIADQNVQWRIFYYLAPDAVVILEVAKKKTQSTPKKILKAARERLRKYKELTEGKNNAD
jgi:phage-related protein